jgi:hypothetical protein
MTKRPPVIVEKRRSPYIAPAKPAPSASPWHTFDVRPKYGKRIVVLTANGEGAESFFVDHNDLLDIFGERIRLTSAYFKSFNLWAYLPDSYRLHFERTQQMPATSREIQPAKRRVSWKDAVARATREEERR